MNIRLGRVLIRNRGTRLEAQGMEVRETEIHANTINNAVGRML